VLIQFARGDRRHQNPGTSELLRTASLEDRAWLYRHDLLYPTMPPDYQMLTVAKDAHNFFAALGQGPWQPVVIGTQEQASKFLASGGHHERSGTCRVLGSTRRFAGRLGLHPMSKA
jgi:hypothetical protein